ncbi:agenet domain-containing protein [Azospirillum doebereinerae]
MRVPFLTFALAAGVMMAGIGGAVAQTKGDWVLGRYKGGDYWFPGVIQSVTDSKAVVVYDDGDKETVTLSNLRPYDWKVGGKVECNYKGAGKWYSGVIASLDAENIGINYDDGDKEKTKTGRCRSK